MPVGWAVTTTPPSSLQAARENDVREKMTCGNPSGGRHAGRLQNPKVGLNENDMQGKCRAWRKRYLCGDMMDAVNCQADLVFVLATIRPRNLETQGKQRCSAISWDLAGRPGRLTGGVSVGRSRATYEARGLRQMKMACGGKSHAGKMACGKCKRIFSSAQNFEGPAVIFGSGL